MVLGRLKVKGDQIIDIDSTNETPVILRGAGLGGWMNMENFITGFSGHEREHRKAMRNVLGQEKYEHFFDKWLDVFFTEEDADYFASLGLNCLRIPFNYQHFEDDMNPRVIKNQGFKYLDKVVKLVSSVFRETLPEASSQRVVVCGEKHLHNPRHARCARGSEP